MPAEGASAPEGTDAAADEEQKKIDELFNKK
jgi:hypothetical protein